MDKKEIANLIKRALFEMKMTQSELAQKMGVSRSVVAQWSNGHNIPPGDKLIQIIGILDIVSSIFPEYQRQEFRKTEEEKEKKILERIDEIEKKLDEQILKFSERKER